MNTSNLFGEEETKIDGPDKCETESKDISNIEQSTPINTIQQIDTGVTKYLLHDKDLAEALNDVCLYGTKHISDGEGGSVVVPDYALRLSGIKMELQLKGHFKEKRQHNPEIDAIYVLQ